MKQLDTIAGKPLLDAADNYAKTYTNFTSSLITNTFDALTDSNLKQIEDYVEYIKVLSKDLTTYINDTKDDVTTDEILNFIESLDLEKYKLLGEDFNGDSTFLEIGATNELVEVDNLNNIVHRDNEGNLISIGGKDEENKDATGGLPFSQRLFGGLFGGAGSEIVKGVGSVIKNLDIPDDTGFGNAFNKIKGILYPDYDEEINNDISTLPYKYPTDPLEIDNATNNLMQAMAIRVQQNKYSLLKEMASMGLLRNVIDGGFVETGFLLSFKEKDVYTEKKKDVVRDRTKTKEKIREKNKISFLPFFKRKRKRKYKQKNTHFEVHKTKTNRKETASAEVNFDARVRINFHTDYKPLS